MAHRRTNKSSKVPNVKLRPAAPRRNRPAEPDASVWERAWDHGSEGDMSLASVVDLCPRPFRRVVLCATGVDDKTTLFKQAIELGAQPYNDLTDKVTHLIAAEPGSAKYKCALENRIPIMHPSWITESHTIWLRGDDVDLHESIEQHRLPIFSGVIMCLSGFEDLTTRTEMNKLLTENGGTYLKNLERPVRVTHLICASNCGKITDKMRYAEKFNQTGEADIQIVWEEWFWDCIAYGGRFDEEGYKTSRPPPQRKSPPDASQMPSRSPSPAEEAARPEQPTNNDDLLASAANDEEEVASARRVPAEMLQIWGSLLKPRGFDISGGKLVRSPSKSHKTTDGGKSVREPSPVRSKAERFASQRPGGASAIPASVLSTFRRAHSFAPVGRNAPASRQPFRRVPLVAPTPLFLGHPTTPTEDRDGVPPVPSTQPVPGQKDRADGSRAGAPSSSSTVFAGLTFRAVGEAKGPRVKMAVEECGGRLVSDEYDGEVDFILVRLISGSNFYRQAVEEERHKYRTECWLERCVFEERICAPEEHATFVPLGIELPIPGSEFVTLSHSGLDQSEACWAQRLARAMGLNVAPNFSRRSTHLLCPSGTGVKAEKAREWGIPVVDMDWLRRIARSGVIPSEHDPEIVAPVEVVPITAAGTSGDKPHSDHKGKGKEKATGSTMLDITNDATVSGQAKDKLHILAIHDKPCHELLSKIVTDCDAFGRPDGLLGDVHSEKDMPIPSSPASAVPTEVSPCQERVKAYPGRLLVADSRGPSIADIGREMKERIPSSASPSPIKLLGVSSTPVSPAISDPASAPNLQRSLSLLGKRPSTEDNSADARTRSGKRRRPPSKTDSFSSSVQTSEDPEVLPVYIRPDKSIPKKPKAKAKEQTEGTKTGENEGVFYSDPGQQVERKRLMQLLETEPRSTASQSTNDAGRGSKRAVRKGARSSSRNERTPGF
ncbi:hypothetical protein WOLCODRAFT_137970 [Wolfiporia cocos MD-104 SS10]|uniref:BRCT domain-containing protein n=1 Tax=Wolfiporia cocos (strain MD-104) TaxID=742152 RepID=A0A2H3JRQ7_WOLCO|nr:hypothetical protein WOLCODRAFT_137970 [Wolfiporia cocos MD-104 SS10]